MALFFFVVGLELKRYKMVGELASLCNVIQPVVVAMMVARETLFAKEC